MRFRKKEKKIERKKSFLLFWKKSLHVRGEREGGFDSHHEAAFQRNAWEKTFETLNKRLDYYEKPSLCHLSA